MRSLWLFSLFAVAACGHSGAGARNAEMGSFRAVGVGSNVDPTIRGARLLPENVDDTVSFGSEAGGGTRVVTSGLRLVTFPKGGIVAAEDRLPQSSSALSTNATTALPERLGGGFLFVIGPTIWRADRWLGAAKPIFTSGQTVQELVVGLDRVYVRAQNTTLAIDGRSGRVLDLGPWPASPRVTGYAAVDGWRAAAITDLRGVVATFDAGATWRALDLSMEPKAVVAVNDALVIGGFEGGRNEAWHELRADGSIARLSGPPRDVKVKLTQTPPPRPTFSGISLGHVVMPTPPPTALSKAPPAPAPPQAPPAPTEDEVIAKTFGKRPLAAAIEDGWPLTDGTAVIARDGALARVRIADGIMTELVRDAFPLKPSRCHPVSLTRPSALGAFGFVCGEPRGTTILYAYEPMRGRLAEIKRFDKPRVVTSSGNGAIAVRGPCAEDGEPTPLPRPTPAKLKDQDADEAKDKSTSKGADKAKSDEVSAKPAEEAKSAPPEATSVHPYCVLGHDNLWREIHVRGDAGTERVVVLADGRIVVISPPESATSPARLTILDGGKARTVPIVFPRVTADVARVLRLGLWLDGFEERRPNVIGGWLEAGGVMLGLEINLEGKATPGQYIRDAGVPFVSGKYGLGWTASNRGFETIDGGMTWTSIDLPEPLVPAAKVERRACGPIGCLAHGWLRVGWGESKREALPSPPPAYRPSVTLSIPSLQLACDPLAPPPPPPPAPKAAEPSSTPQRFPRITFGGPPVLGSFNGLSELPAFYSTPAPTLRDSERGINIEVRELFERYPNVGPLARVYGWGPKTGDWDSLGRWQVKWLSPFAGWNEVRASLATTPPQFVLDMTKIGSGYSYGIISNSSFQLAPGDDGAHALLIGRRIARTEGLVFELEADRAPVEVRRADGEPFGEIEGVVRVAGRWYVATQATSATGSLVTVIWQIEGSVARELGRAPRSMGHSSSSSTARARLARRSDGRAIALVVEGEPTAERANSVRWALPIDLESGALGEPEALGYADLAGLTLDGCTDDVTGWVFDTPMASSSVRLRVPSGAGTLSGVYARLRLTKSRVCVERLTGSYDGQSAERAAQLARTGGATRTAPNTGEIGVTVLSQQKRFPLRCSVSK